MPLGYAGKDLIYGLIDPQMLTEDSSGVIRTPISEVHIMDENYNEVKTYQKSGDYVMRLTISDGNISMKLAKAVKNGNYTDIRMLVKIISSVISKMMTRKFMWINKRTVSEDSRTGCI